YQSPPVQTSKASSTPLVVSTVPVSSRSPSSPTRCSYRRRVLVIPCHCLGWSLLSFGHRTAGASISVGAGPSIKGEHHVLSNFASRLARHLFTVCARPCRDDAQHYRRCCATRRQRHVTGRGIRLSQHHQRRVQQLCHWSRCHHRLGVWQHGQPL